MLRNAAAFNIDKVNVPFLNEVLSLNAQECKSRRCTDGYVTFLNEVLSLNAQEWPRQSHGLIGWAILNEVLSLNAQESVEPFPCVLYFVPQ